jgi:hypothetical protein
MIDRLAGVGLVAGALGRVTLLERNTRARGEERRGGQQPGASKVGP